MFLVRLVRVFALVALIASFALVGSVQPAAADEPIVCTASGDCGWAYEPPTVCYWAVRGVSPEGYEYDVKLYEYDPNGPPPSDDSAYIYCELWEGL
jgi:hypothetical protein